MTDPLVSIIIPLFNAENYIAETINSAINQTWQNKEIIIIDDGSKDSSYLIAKRFETNNVIVVQQENCGASAARNKGLEIAKGEFIQFLDADDLLSENKIEEQVIGLINNPSYVAICDTVYFNNGQNPLQSQPTIGWYSNSFDSNNKFLINLYGGDFIGANLGGMIQPNCWLSPRKILDLAGKWNEDLSVDDDGEYFCRVLLQAEGIYYNPDALNYYRKHDNAQNLSAQQNAKGFISMILATDLKQRHLANFIPADIINQAISLSYQDICILSYPKYKSISSLAYHKAKNLGLTEIKYKGGPISTLLAKIFGWKVIKYINHLRFILILYKF